jgi:cytidylate kinase
MIITISGMPGSGKSTTAKLLAKKLGYKHYSLGDYMREKATARGMKIEAYIKQADHEPQINVDADNYQKNLGKTQDNFVIDGRISWKFIPHSFKVFLHLDPKTAGARVFADHQAGKRHTDQELKTLKDAIADVTDRLETERTQYKNQYHIDFTDPKNYDLVVDTAHHTVESAVDAILNAIKKAKP